MVFAGAERRSSLGQITKEFLLNHFNRTAYSRNTEQLEKEKYLLPFLDVPFNRWFLIPAAILIQFCCGSLYAWSVYNAPIEISIYGQTTGSASITFYIAVGCFGFSAALFGPWLERNGPKASALLGSTGFVVANLLSATAVYSRQMWLLYLAYGVLGGFSLGISYISPVSPLQKFFPDYRGLTSGLAVCGFGAGSIAAAPLQNILISSYGVPLTFIILGLSYFFIMISCAILLRTPPPVETIAVSQQSLDADVVADHVELNPESIEIDSVEAKQFSLLEAVQTRDYRFMYMMFFANTLAGLVILSRLSSMVQDLFGVSKNEGAYVVSINGAFNLGGRFLYGVLSDKIGRKLCFLFTLFSQFIILLSMWAILEARNYPAFLFCIWFLASCYGSSFGLIPAFLADMFGAKNVGACHGIILTSWSIAGVGGGLAYTAIFNHAISHGYTTQDMYPYVINFSWIAVFVAIGFSVTFFIRADRKML